MSSPRVLLLSLSLSLSLLSAAWAIETSHRPSNLTVELSGLIPACAEACFISFLGANYGLARGARIPSLVDLCSARGETGFTVGEGAVQCIAAERRVGACRRGEEDDAAVLYRAYRMCEDQQGAILPTHGVITATLIVPPSGGGPISYPAPSRTGLTSLTSTRLPTRFVVDTRSSTSVRPASTDMTLRTSVASTAAAETTGTPSSTGEAAAAASGASITPVQKAGIALGVIGFAAVAVGLLLMYRLYRAKSRRGRHEPLAGSPRRRDSWGYKFDDRSGGGGGGGGEPASVLPSNGSKHGSPAATMAGATAAGRERALPPTPTPTPPSQQAAASKPPAPRAYNRSSWRPSLIGVAISPSHSKITGRGTPTPPRPVSKLLPAKPVLSLDIPVRPPPPPGIPSPKHKRVASRPPVLPKLQIPRGHEYLHAAAPETTNKPRESTMTEFEEDGRDSSTVLSPETQIWSPPSAASAAYHVADRQRNWMPGGSNIVQAVELEGTTPMSALPKLATSVTILPVAKGRGPGNQTGEASERGPAPRRSSSVPIPPAPARQSIRVVTEPLMAAGDARDDVVPRPLFSGAGWSSRDTAPARRSFGRSLMRPRAPSGDSGITNISVSSDDEHELQSPRASQANLSPVAESPRSGRGRSPVAYPKIPGRENGPTGKEKPAQPAIMPILYKSAHHRTASGGMGNSVAVLTAGPLRPMQNPALLRTGSPTMRIVEPSPEPQDDDRAMLPSAAPHGRHQHVPAQAVEKQQQQQQRRRRRPEFPPRSQAAAGVAQHETHTQPHHDPIQPQPLSQLQDEVRPQQHQAPQAAQSQAQARPESKTVQQHAQRDDPNPPRQEQTHQQQQPTAQKLPPKPGAPSWIPGLPAHPHPLRRPRHTSTLWLPPQARKRRSLKKRKPIETEPHHHEKSPPRPRPQHVDPVHQHDDEHRRHESLPGVRVHVRQQQQQQQPQQQIPQSIIAKRLGHGRAVNMSISTNNSLGSSNNRPRGSGEPMYPSSDLVTPQRYSGDLPSTPTWLPRLTPTRRGEDLYLNVQ
ncbi:hypothetical protein NOR_05063 [Metarhizium rileyi]|uniref:Uncharacterized protein n=1 Tax=Metarhizium rileyi (strain RCEF 4871) TaxID=1649241 RepID=A0A167DCS4_METRR|nr:hypothetical protein NOR_05063 [Metarhizium rileyi RCEF 4871]